MHVLYGPWPARVSWVLLPLLMGPALGDALGEHSLAVARTGAVLAWATWMGVLVAVVLPTTVSLTALRVAAPAALGAANWAALAGDPGPDRCRRRRGRGGGGGRRLLAPHGGGVHQRVVLRR